MHNHSSKKPKNRKISGVLLLDKPQGISSNTALQKVRRLYHAEKAGHTGVLDPLATGLLPICFGEATKFAQYLLDADKAYTATLKLGEATTTGDAEGEMVEKGRSDIVLAEFQTACAALTGKSRQVPPMFSALKHEGKPLYEYARKGIVIERKPRDIDIYHIDVKSFSLPYAQIDVLCSKGTYIRTLSEDIAKYMGTFAHLTALRRRATAGFDVAQSHTMDELECLLDNERDALLLPCDALVSHLPCAQWHEEDAAKLHFGQTVAVDMKTKHDAQDGQPVRIYTVQSGFIGLAVQDKGVWKALRLMQML